MCPNEDNRCIVWLSKFGKSINMCMFVGAAVFQVRSTPAFFMFRHSELLCHWAGGDAAKLEFELRKRLPLDPEMPALPIFSTENAH